MRSILPSLVLLAGTLAVGASAQVVFEPPQVVPLPFPTVFLTNPELGDLDQDGDLDVVYTTGSGPGGFIETLVNDGSGVLTQGPGMQNFPGAQAADLHDMNGDGLPDYVLALGNLTLVLAGDGAGLFDLRGGFSPPFPPNHVAAADVNDDTIPDVVLTTPIVPFFLQPATLQVWAGNGTGFTEIHSQALAGTPTDLDLSDVDGDGRLDAVVTRLDVATWHAGLASGAFGGATAIDGTVAASRVAVGDLDDDGDADLVLGSALPQVQTLVNDGAGAFDSGVTLPAGSGGASPAIADMDSDGIADLVLDDTGSGVGQLVIWRGLGGGAYEEDVHVTAGGQPGGGDLLVADMDGDARPDAYVLGGEGSAVYLNRTYGAGSPFLDLGFALPGSNGYPVQIASGALTAGTPFSFRLLNGLPGAPATLVLGISAIYLPHKGGVMVPSPDFLYPGFVINGAGAFTLSGTWPAGVPSGVTGYLQWWFKDAAGPTPKAASSGLRFTTP
ncbi:MAG TPA: VCBS repeat-containing protein [Planctomycetota bacterium]|nr:VCBS repeat-containing protein [Planctomycetota bacterium]